MTAKVPFYQPQKARLAAYLVSLFLLHCLLSSLIRIDDNMSLVTVQWQRLLVLSNTCKHAQSPFMLHCLHLQVFGLVLGTSGAPTLPVQ